ncbi:MAG: hypothetical protein CSB15_00325 [Clostridiales bacterium]|nr:MAG: hypothetical protein CSB15_00325 [Clostridiales bacterium]
MAAIAILIGIINPLNMDINQRILFSSLIFTVAVWATEAMHKSIACIFLLISFFIFGKTPIVKIVGFVWSDLNFLIISTILLSVGITKTGIIDRFVEYLFKKYSDNILKLLVLPYVFGIILIFIIPQAFVRVIMIGTIFSTLLLENNETQKRAKQALIFNVFIGVSVAYMFFSNGDIVLNVASIRFSGDEVKNALTFGNWFKLMAVPSLVTSIVTLALTYIVFKKELKGFSPDMISTETAKKSELSPMKQKVSILTMIVVIIFWMTYSFHKIPHSYVAIAGVIVMFVIKVLDTSDLNNKNINPHFLLFLVTIFSIGKVLGQSGITEIIFNNLKTLIPEANTNQSLYLIIIAIVVMILHMCIGSSVATMSVVLPIILPLTQSFGFRPEIITLMTYFLVNLHFLLPFHQANIMIGTAKEYYPENYMFRFGIYMTLICPILLYVVFFPWWRLCGVL